MQKGSLARKVLFLEANHGQIQSLAIAHFASGHRNVRFQSWIEIYMVSAMAVQVVEFSSRGYKIGKILPKNSLQK